MMGRGWSASASDASTRPVPLLFIPRPYISATRWAGPARSCRASHAPAAKASTHNASTIARVTPRKSASGLPTASGSDSEALE
jgi:hypothetical protein